MSKVRLGLLLSVKCTVNGDTTGLVRKVLPFVLAITALTMPAAFAAPIPIDSIETLQKIGNDPAYPLDGAYILNQDIDASATASWNDGAGFDPIGNMESRFSGFFNGNGHTIANLTINRPEEFYIGLFGAVDMSGNIKDIGLCGVSVFGNYCVGGLIGWNNGAVTQCYTTGSVSGMRSAGGLIGANHEGLVSQCHATASVSTQGFVAGGLIGETGGGEVTQCQATGTVSGKSIIGGLLGRNNSTVTHCYATGEVSVNRNILGGLGKNGNPPHAKEAEAGNGEYVGGLVGKNESDGALMQCYAMGAVSGQRYIGGLAGLAGGSVTQCYAMGAVSGGDFIGGLAGSNYGTMSQCYAGGVVSGTNKNAGGLVGWNCYGAVTQCYAAGKVSGRDKVGGLIGENNENGEITASFWDIETSEQTASSGGMGITTEQFMQSATFTAVGWDYAQVWVQTDGQTFPYFAGSIPAGTSYTLTISTEGNGGVSPETGSSWPSASLRLLTAQPDTGWAFAGWLGDGFFATKPALVPILPLVLHRNITLTALFLPEAPIGIHTIEDLQKIGHELSYPLSWDYRLENDIDASATAAWNNGAGFVPIGNQAFPFTGVLDGQGFVVSGLTMRWAESDHVGLFGVVGSAGRVENLKLREASVTGYSAVGALAGKNYGALTKCFASGTITGMKIGMPGSVEGLVGGLVGENLGTVMQCYARGEVSGHAGVGGLIGMNNSGSVTQCRSMNKVSGEISAGGLIGALWIGAVTQCYATGAVSGYSSVGGLLGSNAGSVTQCYATGAVAGSFDIGGLVARNVDGTITDAYWDIQTSGQAISAGGAGKTTAEMKSQATFVHWDFDTVWNIIENTTYPYLRNLPQDGEIEGDIEGMEEGSMEGEAEGSEEGPAEGAIEGVNEGEAEGLPEGSMEGEGANEGEDEPGVREVARQLFDAFSIGDIDHNGGLSMSEAGMLIPGLTQQTFGQIDANNNGELDQDELEMAMNQGICGCYYQKNGICFDIRTSLGDVLLFGLSLLILMSWSTFRRN